jgi:hypothetical protein
MKQSDILTLFLKQFSHRNWILKPKKEILYSQTINMSTKEFSKTKISSKSVNSVKKGD